MTPAQFYEATRNDKKTLRKVCQAAGTSEANFYQITIGGSVGRKLAKSLEKASKGKMTRLEILYPEEYTRKRRK